MRRRVATPPGVPIVVDPAATLAYYRKLLDLAYEGDRDSVDALLADLFAEGELHERAAGRSYATKDMERARAEFSRVNELGARQVERRNELIRELVEQVRQLGGVPEALKPEPRPEPEVAPRELTYTSEGAQA